MPGRDIIILDTTLRDGDQSPGFSLSIEQKLVMASHLEKLGVDIVEAGFPASSPGQFEAVRAVAGSLKGAAVSAMARARSDDIKSAGEAVKNASVSYIHTSVSTSPIHRRMKLRKSRSEIIEIAVNAVYCASDYADYVEIGAEDATRTEPEFLTEFCVMVTDAGASVVNIADTVGHIQPLEFAKLVEKLIAEVDAFRNGKARLSVHCHNDLGLSTANALAGLMAGASQAEVTLLGIGERGGNTPLEEIAAAVRARSDFFKTINLKLDMKHFAAAERDLTLFTGVNVQPNKPVAGRNAFSHSSGIHQNGIMVSTETYSILSPEDFGYPPHRFVLSRHSGISGLNARIRDLTGDGNFVTGDEGFIKDFKNLADSRDVFTGTDLLTLLYEEGIINSSVWYLEALNYSRSEGGENSHTVSVDITSIHGERKRSTGEGKTMWEAAISALQPLFRAEPEIKSYSFSGSGGGGGHTESLYVVAEYEGNIYTDEIRGGDALSMLVKSYLNIINQISARYNLAGV